MFISSCLNGNAFSVLLIVPHVLSGVFYYSQPVGCHSSECFIPFAFLSFFVCFGPPFLDVIMAAESSLNKESAYFSNATHGVFFFSMCYSRMRFLSYLLFTARAVLCKDNLLF